YEVTIGFIAEDGRWLRLEPSQLGEKVGEKASSLSAQAPPLPALRELSPDAVFPVLHGPLGEDGAMQGLPEVEGLACVGCGGLGSGVGMDKETTNLLAIEAGLPVLPYAVIRRPQEATASARRLGYPLFVKPARLGSSVGVSKVKRLPDLSAAVAEA